MGSIGFSLQEDYSLPRQEVLGLLKRFGFDGISPPWQGWEDLEELAAAAKELGLAIHSLHAPHDRNCQLWGRENSPMLQQTLACLDGCKEWNIPILVVHPWGRFDYTFQEEELFFDNFDRLTDYAGQTGVKIAFENLQGPEYLMALLDRYAEDPAVGFCWDLGHEQCYPPPTDLLAKYADCLLFTHLNDNYGATSLTLSSADDLHLLPGDGKADWAMVLSRLKAAKPQTVLNFELKIRPKPGKCKVDLYSHLPLETYLQEAAHRANAFAEQYFA